ncbi:PilT protein domain protein [Gloeobacter kilaueensis JS1]|uniref:PilT protein domain protein n=2 Tax=Gloeobacter TaxID=33071 RepID=U5QKY3_GLOK1|nr:PilT protein domain protein [Gloeobacter kilaueensis JS1]
MAWVAQQNPQELFTTSIAEAEISYGVALLEAGQRRTQLESAVRQMFEQDFYRRILPFDSPAAVLYGPLVAQRRKLGKPIAQADAQIAAIVRAQAATLATRNIRDFTDCQLSLISPWQGS